MDASCVVLNPIAERRSGGDINVGLVVSSSESTAITHMDVQRAAKTGRWPTTLLPRWQNLVASGSLQLGYRMPVQPNARGRRFGIFNTVITRSDSIVEEIFCIATERSGKYTSVLQYPYNNDFERSKQSNDVNNDMSLGKKEANSKCKTK